MTKEEALVLTRYVRAACPQQAMDKYTPDTWYDLLDDLSFMDCQAAVKAIGRRQPFIAPCEIREEVREVRAGRLRDTPMPDPPDGLGDDPAAYKAWLAAERKKIMDGPAALRALEAS